MCPVCQKIEPAVDKSIKVHRVILSDSTLYGVWDNPELPNIASHFDIECIVGGRVRDLTLALQKNLLRNDYRFNIIVVAGINNIGEGQSASEIIAEFEKLKEVVANHSLQHKHDEPSIVSICTLSLPPKYCSLKLPDDMTGIEEWKPAADFINRYEVIKDVNEAVKRLNLDKRIAYFNLHLHGIKMLKGGPQHKFDTKAGAVRIWREEQVSMKLHFTVENKLKIVKYLQKTFKNNEGI